MRVSEFVLRKMDEKGKNKKAVYEGISMSRQTFDNRLESGKFFIDEFLDIAKFLGIDPSDIWEEWKASNMIEGIEANSSEGKKRKFSSKYSDYTIQELIRQNGVLVDVIDRLTKPAQ